MGHFGKIVLEVVRFGKIDLDVVRIVQVQGSGLVREVQEDLDVVFREVGIAVIRYDGFERRHAVEIAEEVWSLDVGGLDTMVAQFGEEAAVAAVDGIGDTTEVGKIVIGSTSVDMVDSHSGRDLPVAPSDINGMGSKDMFTYTETMLELQIFGFAVTIFIPIVLATSIFQRLSSVRIDTHAYYPASAVVGIE